MADPKATPISSLPRGPQGNNEDDQQFIQNILSQMSDDNTESEKAYNQTQQNYNRHQFAINQGEQHQRNQQAIQQQQEAQYEQMGGDDQYEQGYQYQEEVPLSMTDKVKSVIKLPLLFLVLYFVLSLPFVRTFTVNQVARFTQNGNYQLFGSSFLVGLVGAIIFYLINRFVF